MSTPSKPGIGKPHKDYRDTIMCQYPRKITVRDLETWMNAADDKAKAELISFIYHRFNNRYITPLRSIPKDLKSGFLMIAAICLLIETLETFYCGEKDSKDKSRKRFEDFFEREKAAFKEFNGYSNEFYYNVRCGVLHQAETRKGYRILRVKSALFDPVNRTVNANALLEAVELSIKRYVDLLTIKPFGDDVWKNALKKMRFICENSKTG